MSCVWNGVDTGDLPTWIGAFGTVAAVGVAYLAFIDQRRRADAAERRAREAENTALADLISVATVAADFAASGAVAIADSRDLTIDGGTPVDIDFQERIAKARELLQLLGDRNFPDVGRQLTLGRIRTAIDELAQLAEMRGLASLGPRRGSRARELAKSLIDYANALEASRPGGPIVTRSPIADLPED